MQKNEHISFWSAVLMSINIIIGAGIFFNPQPSLLLRQSGYTP